MTHLDDRRMFMGAMAGALAMAGVGKAFAAGAVDALVRRIADTMAKEYQDAALGRRVADALVRKLAAGDYAKARADEALAEQITKDLRAVVNDKHMAVMFAMPAEGGDLGTSAAFQRKINYGVQSVRRLGGNVGVIELNFFPSMSFGEKLVGRYAAAMTLVRETRALIVDVRQHMGGEPAAIAYFVSYFFDRKPFLVNEIRFRNQSAERFFTTEPQGPRYGEARPVFVLTSSDTFSGGEEFAYDLQALKRARIVGETTGGGANPNRAFDVGARFTLLVPNGRAVNPITHTNWEGVGVKPDIAVPAAKALDVAQRRALDVALAQAATKPERDSIQEAIAALRPQ